MPIATTALFSTISQPRVSDECSETLADVIPAHPLGIKPSGNSYTASSTATAKAECGLFSILPDELIIHLLDCFTPQALLHVGATCKALYVFCCHEDLWRSLFIRSQRAVFKWRGSWRSTYLNIPETKFSKLNCSSLYSDILYRPFFCSRASLMRYTLNIPPQNLIPRIEDLSLLDFSSRWTSKPFILTEPVRKWPIYQSWSIKAILEKYGEIEFTAEAVEWPLKTYIEYMEYHQDESPLYLFDSKFVEKMNIMVGACEDAQYWSPRCFEEDHFAILGDQRPDYRWLIMGPERSGSTFHKDPNATSAWNAVLCGSKYWIMFPSSGSSPPPPGVFVSEDQSEVTSPLSITEWLLGFHDEARKTPGCLEGICNDGEVLYVPSGWWHLVVNLSPSIAITQNFVPRAHLAKALKFLKDKPGQVSGFNSEIGSPYDLFVERLQENCPEVLEEAKQDISRIDAGRKRKWNELINDDRRIGAGPSSFIFEFQNIDDEEDEDQDDDEIS